MRGKCVVYGIVHWYNNMAIQFCCRLIEESEISQGAYKDVFGGLERGGYLLRCWTRAPTEFLQTKDLIIAENVETDYQASWSPKQLKAHRYPLLRYQRMDAGRRKIKKTNNLLFCGHNNLRMYINEINGQFEVKNQLTKAAGNTLNSLKLCFSTEEQNEIWKCCLIGISDPPLHKTWIFTWHFLQLFCSLSILLFCADSCAEVWHQLQAKGFHFCHLSKNKAWGVEAGHCKKTLSQLPEVDMQKLPGSFSLMRSDCAYCTVTVPKHLHMQTGGFWMTAVRILTMSQNGLSSVLFHFFPFFVFIHFLSEIQALLSSEPIVVRPAPLESLSSFSPFPVSYSLRPPFIHISVGCSFGSLCRCSWDVLSRNVGQFGILSNPTASCAALLSYCLGIYVIFCCFSWKVLRFLVSCKGVT
ncbi:hypothetical protein VP01_75g2 [Puccinia sorghi]|uniref:Uncharacterized protein n=1 Tax=Puccinia sorghi TaxID=27349 RepID=A0A0L6UE15_9BASI|nr:hypothetical protein VP01_75g2 [Puccinia sorghi]